MCGIAGQFNFEGYKPVARETIMRMARSIAHRGPDDEGFFIAGPVGLGFRRLSIIDLAGGHQPMSDAEETIWVIFNGEIYNYRELRASSTATGHRFRTNSDTEVIVHGYKEWGLDVLNHLNGMFGLAIWDVAKERLVVARDAMGIKLIYYRLHNGALTFGSEIRAVRAADERDPEVDPVAVSLFLTLPLHAFAVDDFQRHPQARAGHDAGRGERPVPRGALVQLCPRALARGSAMTKPSRNCSHLYQGAVRRHLLSDVPVGILLSGGLDSGLLLALMNETGDSWPAYTVGYGETFEDDELQDAAETAAILGARHIPVKLDRAGIRTVAAGHRRIARGADRLLVRRPDVFCFATGSRRT